MGSLPNPVTPILAFSASDVPLEPTRLRAGDSWNWVRAFAQYTSALYTLSYIFNSPDNLWKMPGAAITADQDGQSFDIQTTAAQTAAVTPDTYDLIAVLTGITGLAAAGQQVTIPLQSVIVDPNIAAATTPIDTRSFVKKTLDMIEAAIAGNIAPDVQEYMISGNGGSRQIRRIAPKELLALRAEYKNLYKAELRANGLYTSPRKIGFRFTIGS